MDLARAPKKPRRLRTAYSYFVHDNYHLIRKDQDSRKPQPIISRLGKMWRELSDDDRKMYMKMEERDRCRYEQAKKEWTRQFVGKPMGYLNRKRREPYSPLLPRSAYMFFRAELAAKLREEMPGVTSRARDKQIVVRWHKLDIQSRDKYATLADRDRLRYTKEMNEFRDQQTKNARLKQEERLQQLQAQVAEQQRLQQQGPVVAAPI